MRHDVQPLPCLLSRLTALLVTGLAIVCLTRSASAATPLGERPAPAAFANPLGNVPVAPNDRPVVGPDMIPADPLFVADPLANKVFICDATATGTVACGIFRGGTPLFSPHAVAAGHDCLPSPWLCGNYLWVANVGNNLIHVFKIVPGFPLVCTITNSTINHPAGIAYFEPASQIVVSNSNTNAITTYHSNCPTGSPFIRNIIGGATTLSAPLGPSLYRLSSSSDYVYVRNQMKVTIFNRLASGNAAPVGAWTVGQALDGTAADPVSKLFFVTGVAPTALWSCSLSPNGLLTGCPTSPTGAIGLNFPGIPATSSKIRRVYVPNIVGGNVTAYFESAPGTPVATYFAPGLANFMDPTGTAVLF